MLGRLKTLTVVLAELSKTNCSDLSVSCSVRPSELKKKEKKMEPDAALLMSRNLGKHFYHDDRIYFHPHGSESLCGLWNNGKCL